jgi:hypothetical protein
MVQMLDRDMKYRRLATAGSTAALFLVRRAPGPRLWLAAVRGKKECRWHAGATPRLRAALQLPWGGGECRRQHSMTVVDGGKDPAVALPQLAAHFGSPSLS